MKKNGFMQDIPYKGFPVTVYYMDCKGKDCGIERWRIDLYYDKHLASTLFKYSEKEYNKFIEEHQEDCYENYNDFIKEEL